MPRAWLTIDDSPSQRTPELLDFLESQGIQALLFVRGHRMEETPEHFDYIVEAIQRGHVIGNHSYAHEPASALSFEAWVEDFEKCEDLIYSAYEAAEVGRPGKYYRFPYLDRGNGTKLEQGFPEMLGQLAAGEMFVLERNKKVAQIQAHLKEAGCMQPFANIGHPLYTHETGFAQAHDCLLTYSTQDWKMTGRHQESSLEDLKRQMGNDPFIARDQIMLVHDEAEIHETTKALILEMKVLGFTFKPIIAPGTSYGASGSSHNVVQAPELSLVY